MVVKKLIALGTLPVLLSGCFVPLIVGGTAVVGTAATESRGIDGVARDNRIRSEITYKWVVEKADATGIDVTVYNGKVLLVGHVKDQLTEKKVLEALKKVSGIKQVINELKVGGGEGFDEFTRDAWMTTKLKSNMMLNNKIPFQNYTLRTFDKTIYIFGIAQSREELDAVLKEARAIKGVKSVKSFIEILATKKPLKRGEDPYAQKEGIAFQNPETPKEK
ncbi:BON domain-containing protein [Candidatus Bealeia paramacronuclearis]|uniref:BON domain-containing protein n=1 Tax=Candidatus Bealeia paramacronuclearis TaxID=1921001 RepID=A0ABZ2C512_9PROT|nr:BON domain-containing protein [Candidatus Bealeia paramacronuclearis]